MPLAPAVLLPQVPSGVVADRVGGARLLLTALLLWSSACLLTATVAMAPSPFAALVVVRGALGLAQSCFVPAVSALAARWFDPGHRARSTSEVYACYSAGTVAGLVVAPLLAAGAAGWQGAFAVLGGVGVVYALAVLPTLPRERSLPWELPVQQQGRQARQQARVLRGLAPLASAGPSATPAAEPAGRAAEEEAAAPGPRAPPPAVPSPGWLPRLLLLCLAHSVISVTFFLTQAWIPTFLHASLGLADLGTVGMLSALPWLVSIMAAVMAGTRQRALSWLPHALLSLHTSAVASCGSKLWGGKLAAKD